MADMLNTRPLDHSVTEIDYKPISGWAVAALTISGIYIAWAGSIAVTALYYHRPALSWFVVILAAIGLVLSIVARIHIKRSEGTRDGLKQATIAWWLSVLGGVAFLAYLFASKLALEQQAERAANEWFSLLKEAGSDPVKLNQAFLQTIEPTRRQNIDPADSTGLEAHFGAGPLPSFRNSELLRLFERNGKDVEVASLGVSSLQQTEAGYQLDYTFQIRSPEGIANLNLVLFGSEGKNIAGREWHVGMPPGGLTIQSTTTYGRLLLLLQDEAREVGMTWMFAYKAKDSASYYLLTLPADKRAPLAAALDAVRIAIHKIAGLTVPPLSLVAIPDVTLTPNEAKPSDFPFYALNANRFFHFGTVTNETKRRMREAFRFGRMERGGESRLINLETTPQLLVTPQEIRYTFPVELGIPGTPMGFYGGRLVIVSRVPELIAELNDLYAKGKANPGAKDETANPLAQRPPRNWQAVRLEVNLEPLQAPKQGPGPGAGPGGPPGPAGPQ